MRRLGLIAFTASRGGLELVDLARCRVTVLRRGGASKPRFSPDGHWLAYERDAGFPVVVPASAVRARAPLGVAHAPLGVAHAPLGVAAGPRSWFPQKAAPSR